MPGPRRARSFALLATTTVALLVGPLVQPASASVSATYENRAIAHTNSERSDRDRVKLKKSKCLDRFAERQARAMAASRTLHHQPMRPVLDACRLSQAGENVAFGYPSGTAVVNAWMHSADHQQNLLNSRHRMIGLGAYQDAEGYWYISEVLGRKL